MRDISEWVFLYDISEWVLDISEWVLSFCRKMSTAI